MAHFTENIHWSFLNLEKCILFVGKWAQVKPQFLMQLIGAKALFSDFASPDDLCQVDFTFEVKGKKYRILRNPPKNLEKKDSQEGKVAFFEIVKNNEELLISKKISEVDKSINQLIGLTDDEFSRIVLLPQGEFAAFLKQKSSEKQKTLAKLFPSEYYSKIIDHVTKINDDI